MNPEGFPRPEFMFIWPTPALGTSPNDPEGVPNPEFMPICPREEEPVPAVFWLNPEFIPIPSVCLSNPTKDFPNSTPPVGSMKMFWFARAPDKLPCALMGLLVG
jgi:hypothetical protein